MVYMAQSLALYWPLPRFHPSLRVLSSLLFFSPRTHTTQGISQSCDVHENIHHDDMVSFKFDIADT